jgi:hypothetical protein
VTTPALGAAALALLGTVSVAALAPSASRKRSVEMEITLPNGAVPRAIVPEDEGVSIKLPDLRRFGFVPTIRNGDVVLVVIALWDLDRVPIRLMGHIETAVGGPAVYSDTSPSFGVRILRVIKPK